MLKKMSFGKKTFLNGKHFTVTNVPALESISMGYPSFKMIVQVRIESRVVCG